MPNQFYTTAELAKLLKTNPQVIRQSRVDGKLFDFPAPKFIKLGKAKILYPAYEVYEYLSLAEPQRITY